VTPGWAQTSVCVLKTTHKRRVFKSNYYFFKKTGKEKPAQMATDDSNDEFLALESEDGMCL
jgi:hypothetical protein